MTGADSESGSLVAIGAYLEVSQDRGYSHAMSSCSCGATRLRDNRAAVAVQVVPAVQTPLQQLRPVAHRPFCKWEQSPIKITVIVLILTKVV